MKSYELTVLTYADKEDATIEALKDITDKVYRVGGKIYEYEDDGKKRLAYPINAEDYAHYTYIGLKLPKDGEVKLSGYINNHSDVLRYLLVMKDKEYTDRSLNLATTVKREVTQYMINRDEMGGNRDA